MNTFTFDRVELKSDCNEGSNVNGVRQGISFIFGLESSAAYVFPNELLDRIKFSQKICFKKQNLARMILQNFNNISKKDDKFQMKGVGKYGRKAKANKSPISHSFSPNVGPGHRRIEKPSTKHEKEKKIFWVLRKRTIWKLMTVI